MQITSTREEKLEALHGWQARRVKMDKRISALNDLVGIAPESPFVEAIQTLQEQDRIFTSLIVEDRNEWLDWYCYENNFGAGGMTAELGGAMILVPDVEALLSVIEA